MIVNVVFEFRSFNTMLYVTHYKYMINLGINRMVCRFFYNAISCVRNYDLQIPASIAAFHIHKFEAFVKESFQTICKCTDLTKLISLRTVNPPLIRCDLSCANSAS